MPSGNTPSAVFGQNWLQGQGAQLGSQGVFGLGGTDIFNQIPLPSNATQAVFAGDHNWTPAVAIGATPAQLYAGSPSPFSVALGVDALYPVFVGINNLVSPTFGVPVYPGNRLQIYGWGGPVWVCSVASPANISQTYSYRAA